MIGRAHHLNDDRLFECYMADRSGEPFDPPAADHLADCASCQARYADLTGFFEGVRAEADLEADQAFTPEQLHHQQEQILRRIEHLNRSARVISFPGRAAREMSDSSMRIAPRWLAAAAVAGLFVGGAVGGMFLEPTLHRRLPTMRVATPVTSVGTPAPAVLVSSPAPTGDALDDDLFLKELEFALERPHTRELQPFDALTPRIQEIGSRVR